MLLVLAVFEVWRRWESLVVWTIYVNERHAL